MMKTPNLITGDILNKMKTFPFSKRIEKKMTKNHRKNFTKEISNGNFIQKIPDEGKNEDAASSKVARWKKN